MTSLPETINKKAAEAFPGCEVHIADLSNGCGAMYCVTLVWDKFEDMNRLKKHRLVNTTFKDEIKLMHAFEQKTFTRAQYEEYKKQLDNESANPEETQ